MASSPAPTPRTNPGRELLEHFAPNPDVPWSDDSPVLAFYDDLRQRIVKIEEAAAGLAVEELARANPGPAAAPLEPPRPDLDEIRQRHARDMERWRPNWTEASAPSAFQDRGRLLDYIEAMGADSGTAQPPLDRDIRRVIAAENPAAYPEWYDDRDRWPFIEGTNWTIWLLRRLGAASERPEAPK